MDEPEIKVIDASAADVHVAGLPRMIELTLHAPSRALDELLAASVSGEVVRVLTSGDGIVGVVEEVTGLPERFRVVSVYLR